MKTKALLHGLLGIAACTTASAADPHGYAYAGRNGPDHWAALSADFSACASGRNQSPIDLAGVHDAELPERPARLNARFVFE